MISGRSRWARKLSAILGILFLPVLVSLYLTSSSPKYQGKSLEQWIQLIDTQDLSLRKQAIESVRAIGANAVPVLTQWMEHRDTEAERRFHRWLTSNRSLETFWPALMRKSENHREYMALLGFYALGSEARSALPALERLILEDNSVNPAKPGNAAHAYVYVDPTEADRLVAQWEGSTNHLEAAAADRLKKALEQVQAEGVKANNKGVKDKE